MDCKALIYSATRQEVITPIYPNRLVKWSVSSLPQAIDEMTFSNTLSPVPN